MHRCLRRSMAGISFMIAAAFVLLLTGTGSGLSARTLGAAGQIMMMASSGPDATGTAATRTNVPTLSVQLSPAAGLPCNLACIAPDNGSGSVDLPAGCPYTGLGQIMQIINGLPPGSTIDIDPVLSNFINIIRTPGGSLGGETLQFQAGMQMSMQGKMALAGFSRTIFLPVIPVTVDDAPKGAGPVQSFDADMMQLQGQITGDPDFDLLRVSAGTSQGLPSPGHTTLSQLPNGTWSVDSFFDITYRIDFIGAPGGALAGMSGSTTGTIRMQQGHDFWQPGDSYKMHFPQLPDPAGWDVFAVSPQVLGDDFLCTESGPIKDIHFWGSWRNDVVGQITGFDITIRADVPAVIGQHASHPGAILWQKSITDFCTLPLSLAAVTGGWYDPATNLVLPGNHTQYFEYDITLGPNDWFSQTQGTIYWLCISAHLADPVNTQWGWESSPNHYNDDATWQLLSLPTCIVPDDGLGSADTPANCPYLTINGTMDMINGLPMGSQIHSAGALQNFTGVVRTPGGSLGGESDQFQATLHLDMQGTGSLSGFSRTTDIPITSGLMDQGPRMNGAPLQSFPSEMMQLQGQITGDPDFDLLRVTAGDNLGMPSPGHTTLAQGPGTSWTVDSFFDLTYRIDFIGAPGGPLAGMSGSTTGTVRIQQGESDSTWHEMYEPPALQQSLDLAFVITNGAAPCDCTPGDANHDGGIDISDAVYLIQYIFSGGPAPAPYTVCSGDANCDCIVDISDAVYLISYIFAGGPAPCDCQTWSTNCGIPMK